MLGGDGTILRALRRYAGTDVPVFAINFGEIGFLATVEPEELEDGIRRALSGDFELLRLPAIVLETPRGQETAINDVAIHRRAGERVAELAYELDGEEVGSVRCDGLVIATPAGSTGYNLANGGPVMAWGVEGFVVSFIAPHSITARALVAAPSDTITIHNRSREALDVAVDGRPVCELEAGGAITRAVRRRRRHDRAAPRLLVLPPPAREVRAPRPLSVAASSRRVEAAGRRQPEGPVGPAGPCDAQAARELTRGVPVCAPRSLLRCSESTKLSSCSREKRRWPPGVR